MSEQANIFERWPGYDEQSWRQRFAELDRQHKSMQERITNGLAALSTPPATPGSGGNVALEDAITRARQWLANATDEEKEAMWAAQRKSFTSGPYGPTDGMGTVIVRTPPATEQNAKCSVCGYDEASCVGRAISGTCFVPIEEAEGEVVVTQADIDAANRLEEIEWPGNHAAWSHIIAEHFATHRITSQAAMREALEKCRGLIECIAQTPGNVWYVAADDPETAVGDTYLAVRAALGMGG